MTVPSTGNVGVSKLNIKWHPVAGKVYMNIFVLSWYALGLLSAALWLFACTVWICVNTLSNHTVACAVHVCCILENDLCAFCICEGSCHLEVRWPFQSTVINGVIWEQWNLAVVWLFSPLNTGKYSGWTHLVSAVSNSARPPDSVTACAMMSCSNGGVFGGVVGGVFGV